MTSATFCESSPESSPPNTDGRLGVVLAVCPRFSSSYNRSEVSKGWCEDGAGVLPVLIEEVELM